MTYPTVNIAHMLARQAWQRAKAELYSVLEAHVAERVGEHEPYLKKERAIEKFIKDFEDNHL